MAAELLLQLNSALTAGAVSVFMPIAASFFGLLLFSYFYFYNVMGVFPFYYGFYGYFEMIPAPKPNKRKQARAT